MALRIYETTRSHWLRNTIITVILFGLLGAGAYYGYKWYTSGEEPPVSLAIVSAGSETETKPSDTDIVAYTVEPLEPRYLTIAALGVDATRILPTDFDDNQMLKLPQNIHDLGWYTKSGTPGSDGVIVMNGYTAGASTDAPLSEAGTLDKGARITIERGDGKKIVYSVVDVTSYGVEEFNATISATLGTPVTVGSEGLNLVLTSGKWVPRLSTYDQRLLIRASIAN